MAQSMIDESSYVKVLFILPEPEKRPMEQPDDMVNVFTQANTVETIRSNDSTERDI